MPPRVPKLKTEESTNAETTWRSRFPVARIKKIMQADEDVGKVAQVVPVIISRSVELFMASIVKEASLRAVETGHKRVLPGHMKLAVKSNSMFDFLEPLVEKLPDPVHAGAKPVEDKKMRKGRAKRPTEENDDDDDAEFRDESAQQRQHEPQHQRPHVSQPAIVSPSISHHVPAQHNPHQHQHKKVKSEDSTEERKPASRTMSIANMMSNDDDE